MRKLFWVPLVVLAFVAGMFYGVQSFIQEMAKLHGCTTEEWTEWYQQQKQKQRAMQRFR